MVMFDHETNELLKKILKRMEEEHESTRAQLREVIRILRELVQQSNPATAIKFIQVGGNMIPQGGQGTFQEVLTPPNGALKSGPVWTADDPSVTLVPSADGSSVIATVPNPDTNATFNLTISAVSADAAGTALTFTGPVTIGPPVVVPATAISWQQIA